MKTNFLEWGKKQILDFNKLQLNKTYYLSGNDDVKSGDIQFHAIGDHGYVSFSYTNDPRKGNAHVSLFDFMLKAGTKVFEK